MANYFVINNKFKPYSFDELIKPYQMYGQAYKEQEALVDAAKEKEFSPDYLDQTLDREAYNMYNTAVTGLQGISDELATKGLSAGLRGRARTVARDYLKTMNALDTAQKQLAEERAARAKLGSDYVYQQENLRIGDYLHGKSPNQRRESLSTIAKDVATQFTNMSKGITKDSWDRLLNKNGNVINGYYDVTTETGLTAAQLDTILSDDKTWSEMMKDDNISSDQKKLLQGFRNAVQAKKDAIGYNKYDDFDRDRIDDAILRGASYGLVNTSHKYERDVDYNPTLDFQKRQYYDTLKLKKEQLELKYPQYQFDNKGNVIRNEDGSIKLTPGWKQDTGGRWVGPNGQISSSSSGGGRGSNNTRYPYIGVIHFGSNGEVSKYGSDKEWNTARKDNGSAITRYTQLSRENLDRLATTLGILDAASDQEVYNEAIRRGITISVINHGFVKDSEGKKTTTPNDKQEMILRGTKTFIGQNAEEEEEEDETLEEGNPTSSTWDPDR